MSALPKTNSHLIQLKHHLSSVDHSNQNIVTTIGLLASSGLNHTEKIAEMCHLLKKLFKLNTCGFFWSDQDGNMQDAWCLTPDFLSFKTLMSCLAYQASGTRVWPPFQENVLAGPMAGYLLPFQNEQFYASPYFQESYHTQNVRHILDVVLHDGTRPWGAFLMMRSAQQGRFTPDERRLLTKLIPILNQAFSVPSLVQSKYAKKEMSGFALLCKNGKYKSMSEEARRIVWMLTHIEPGSFANPNDPSIEHHLEHLVAKHEEQIKSGEKLSIEIDNRWGRFNLAFEQEPKAQDIILMLRRKVPLSSQLAFALLKFNFPPMRQIVAWLLAHNLSRNEIAAELDICAGTVTEHIKLIYKATKTSSSHGLLMCLQS